MQMLRNRAIGFLLILLLAGCGKWPHGDLTIRTRSGRRARRRLRRPTTGRHGAGQTATELPATPTCPTTWSKTEHVRWQSPVPGRGHASPIVCGDRVFLTTADEEKQQHRLLAYDRNDRQAVVGSVGA